MVNFVSVGGVDDFIEGSIQTVDVAGKNVAVARVGEEFFAVDDTCTHEQCSLGGEGYLEGTTIICGCHGAQFDVTSGKVLAMPAVTYLITYEVKIENGEVLIGV